MLDFVVEYINSEKLGMIDNSHLIHAEKNLKKYAHSKICIKLAEYHGKAVDYGKTGIMPEIPPKLFATTYPDFMGKPFNVIN
jgi:hypothetical protein